MHRLPDHKKLIVLAALVSAAFSSKAQTKLGESTQHVRKDALLELVSPNKGLLLSRVTTASLNAHPLDTSAAGMVVYNLTNNTLYVKKGAGAAGWNQVMDQGSFNLASLSDIALSGSPSANQLLRHNGTSWVNWTPDFITPTTHTLASLADFQASGTIAANQMLRYNGTRWENWTPVFGISNLNDVSLASLATNQLLRYNGTNWVNWTPTYLNATITTPATNQLLRYNGTNWVNWTPTYLNATITTPATNQLLQYNGTNWVNWTPTYLNATITTPATNQLLQYNGTNWVNWTPNFIPNTQTLTLTGDVTTSGTALTGSSATTLANSGVTAGTYTKITVDAKGRATSGANLAAADLPSGSANYIQNQTAAAQAAGFNVNGTGTVNNLNVSAMTGGSVLFAGASGAVSQNNAKLFWDNTAGELGVNTATPAANLDVAGTVKLGTNGTVLANVIKTNFTSTNVTTWDYNTTNVVTYTLTGVTLKATDNIILNPRVNLPSRISIGWVRVSNAATSQIQVGFINSGANASLANNTIFDVTIIQL